jgi:DNA-binding NtrC family response regulator
MSASVLIVDDDRNIRRTLSTALELDGFSCQSADHASAALEAFAERTFDVVLLDVQLPDASGLDLLVRLRAMRPEVPIVIMTGHGTSQMAFDAIARGASNFLDKPIRVDTLLVTLQLTLQLGGRHREMEEARGRVRGRAELIGSGPGMQRLRETIALAAPSKGRVLITGESGTGKELIARALHAQSPRRDKPFIKVNCAAIPSELIESELFGHERGAFTGAHQARRGRFELADGGTLFLDEIGDMRLDVQAKLLRALQEGEVERVGGSQPIRIDVRVIAATHKDLEAAISAGEFREDLFYRLNVVPIHAPPLRERAGDVPELARGLLMQVCDDNGLRLKQFDAEALELLARRPWPGNVRELRNVCERLAILTPSQTIDAAAVRLLLGEKGAGPPRLFRPGVAFRDLVADAEREILRAALEHHSGNMTQTASGLDLERSHLYKKLKALGLRDDGGAEPQGDPG